MTAGPKQILIVGGGYVGMYTALRLRRSSARAEAEITVVDPQPHMTYQPFLPEAAAGNISPRHVVVPLRRVLKKCRVVTGEVTPDRPRPRGARPWSRSTGGADELGYDHLVVAPGSVVPDPADPRAGEHGIGFKTIGEAIYLRNHVLSRLDVAASTDGPGDRQPGADLRLRRRRLRRHRGAGRDGGHGARRLPVLPRARARRHALGAGRGGRPDPARGRPRDVALHRRAATRARHRHPARHPAGVVPSTAGSSCPTARASTPTRWSGRPGSRRIPLLARTGLPRGRRGPAARAGPT